MIEAIINGNPPTTQEDRLWVKKQLDGYCCVPHCYNETIWSCFCRTHGDKYFKYNQRGKKLTELTSIPAKYLPIVEYICREGSEQGVLCEESKLIDEAIELDLLKVNNGFVQITPLAFGLLE